MLIPMAMVLSAPAMVQQLVYDTNNDGVEDTNGGWVTTTITLMS